MPFAFETRVIARTLLAAAVLMAAIAAVPASASAQNNRFGVQDRANSAEHLVVIAVQQAISALPPTSAQSVSFVYDTKSDTWLRSKQLGPTVLRSPRTLPPGQLSVRLSTSYLQLDERFGPIDYRVDGLVAGGNRVRFDLATEATVGVVGLSSTYALSKDVELSLNVPLVVTDASAKEIYIADPTDPDSPFPVPLEPPDLIDQAVAAKQLQVAHRDMNSLGVDFPNGVQTGLGRIGVGVKVAAPTHNWLRIALASELLLPSPNENELAGSESTAWSARLLTEYPLPRRVSAFLDAGYEHDFEHDTLSRFVWSGGASVAPTDWLATDIGVGGSQYDKGVKWTPNRAPIARQGFPGMMAALGDNSLGTTFVDLLIGGKVRIATDAVVTGAITFPLTTDGFRPEAAGTWAVEVYF